MILALSGHYAPAQRRARGEDIDADRLAWAARLVSGGASPIAAYLVAVRGWSAAIARAYALLGEDAAAVVTSEDVRQAARERKLIQ